MCFNIENRNVFFVCMNIIFVVDVFIFRCIVVCSSFGEYFWKDFFK